MTLQKSREGDSCHSNVTYFADTPIILSDLINLPSEWQYKQPKAQRKAKTT